MTGGLSSRHSDRGAILVQVALALLALVAFTMFVVDYGVFWVGRRQAQNAADASALAGALAIAFDDDYPYDPSETGVAKVSASAVAQANSVFGDAVAVNTLSDVLFPSCPDGSDACVRVNVLRTADRANPLPSFFGAFVGRLSQDIRATATAHARPANASACMAPWALPDRWVENFPAPVPFTAGLLFNGPQGDVYVRPTPGDIGTGFGLGLDRGTQMVISLDQAALTAIAFKFWPVSVDVGCTTAECYRAAISSCRGGVLGIGDQLVPGPAGLTTETRLGVADLIALDPQARWDGPSQSIVDSCVGSGLCPGLRFSPRLVAVPLVDSNRLTGDTVTVPSVIVRNVLGLFIDEMIGDDIYGYAMPLPGVLEPLKDQVSFASAFARSVVLIR